MLRNESTSSPVVTRRNHNVQTPEIKVSGEENARESTFKQKPGMKRMESENISESLINKLNGFLKEKKDKAVQQNKPALPDSPKPKSRSVANIRTITSREAARLLDRSPPGTWILRLNEKGEERITIAGNPVNHIKLYEFPGGLFSLRAESGDPKPLQNLLKNLQESGTLGTQFFPGP